VRHKQDRGGPREKLDPENVAMQTVARVFSDPELYERAQKFARVGQWPFVRGGSIGRLPGRLAGWTAVRDLEPIPKQSFREWWRQERGAG
jgi:L-lactate dehydrogenase complex protein LldF